MCQAPSFTVRIFVLIKVSILLVVSNILMQFVCDARVDHEDSVSQCYGVISSRVSYKILL